MLRLMGWFLRVWRNQWTNKYRVMKSQGPVLAKNTMLNCIGQLIPGLVAVVTIPYAIAGLGVERFGILSLAWLVVGYFSLVDLGLGTATTKFVAEALGKGKPERLLRVFWTSVLVQFGFGLLGGLLAALATPLLVEKLLKIPTYLLHETKLTFYLLSGAIPIVVCSRSLQGALGAAQRFDLVNAVNIPATSLVFALPAVGVVLGFELPGIIILVSISWMARTFVYLVLCLQIFPALKVQIAVDRTILPSLVSFGGWVALCNALIPVLVSVDRFLVGALLSVAALAYYTTPYEVASRLLIIPGSLAATLFPAFAAVAEVSVAHVRKLYDGSLKWVILTMGPIVAIGVFLAGDILRVWLGEEFAGRSTKAMQILMAGMLLNALSQMPACLLDAMGRPDLRAKIFMSYVPIYVGLLWIGITNFGLEGAALAWMTRAGLEFLLFTTAVSKLTLLSPLSNDFVKALISYGAFLLLLFASGTIVTVSLATRAAAAAGCLMAYGVVVWRYILTTNERDGLCRVLIWWPWAKQTTSL